MRRTGIDLSSMRCNVVDAESSGRRRKGGPAAFRVHNFATVTHLDNTSTLTHELKALAESGKFSRKAWVNLWDVRSSHQYLLLPSAPDSELESRARHHGASVLGMSAYDVTVATSLGGMRGEPGHHPKREVSFFAAGSDDIRRALAPIVEAGFSVEGVTTPCGALWSEALLRRALLPGEVHAHVALGLTRSALGIFGDGALLYARDLEWGYAPPVAAVPAALERERLADRLSTELRRSFLYLKQYWEQDVSQIVLCGDMPDIRSLTAPLIERLNIEVETLDTLEGIDPGKLPDGFAERASTLRLASSIAVEPPPVNLLPVEVTARRTSVAARRIVMAGTAAAVAFGAFLYGQASVARRDAEQRLDSVRSAIAALPPSSPNTPGSDATLPQMPPTAAAPALARVLEQIGRAMPKGVLLQSLRATRDAAGWRVSIKALAAGSDSAGTLQTADRFLRALDALPTVVEHVRPPDRRFRAEAGGVEISAVYRLKT